MRKVGRPRGRVKSQIGGGEGGKMTVWRVDNVVVRDGGGGEIAVLLGGTEGGGSVLVHSTS